MKIKFYFFLIPLFILGITSCAHPQSAAPISDEAGTEKDVDAALGVLSEKKTEAQKQLDELEVDNEAKQEQAFQARIQREEEQRKLQRNITEDIIRQDQQ